MLYLVGAVNRFLRTAPTRQLLGVVFGVIAAIAVGTTIAIAAAGSGPVPPPMPLANAIHAALSAKQVPGISADIKFTNHLISSSEILGSDPLLSGASGRIWLSKDHLRLELQGGNGDANIVAGNGSWWAYDPSSNTVYEGKLPAASAKHKDRARPDRLPTVAQIQAQLNHLMQHLGISGAAPTDVAGRPTYTVTVSPKSSGGLLGSVQLAWDALRGVPLRFAVYAHGDSTPVIELEATGISYAPVDSSVFKISPPSGAKVVRVATPAGAGGASERKAHGKGARHRTEITGVRAVARRLSFHLAAPPALAGRTRRSVTLLDWAGHPAALLTYGQGFGSIVVLEQQATAQSARKINLSSGSGERAHGISLPTVSINGVTAQELDTALGTLVRFTLAGVTYTVAGSVRPAVADAAARSL